MLLTLSGWLPVAVAADKTGADGTANAALQGDSDAALSFDSDFLSMGGQGDDKQKHVDLSYFAHKGGMQPGRYPVQVKVNGKLTDDGRVVEFRSWPNQRGKLYACVTATQMLEWWGIKASQSGTLASVSPDDPQMVRGKPSASTSASSAEAPPPVGQCPTGGVAAMVPYAKEVFDFNKHLLDLTVPQASLGPASLMRIPPHLWDEGIPAILMNYNYTGSQQKSQGRQSGSDFLGVNGQLNVLGWRVRNDLTWHKSQGQSAELNASQVYAERDFAAFGGGQLTVGQTTSGGGGGDSVSFVGAKVDSDDSMLDPKFTAYSPAITGIANSPATVTVRQYGKVIYQQNVPQGPFSLTDFNRSGNGDVDVEIREADGRTHHFTLASVNAGNLLRQGGASYSASTGQASGGNGYADNRFVQAGGSYGAWANATLTGGVLLSRNYQAASVGTSIYAGAWGAVSYNLRTSRADLGVVPGQSGAETGVAHDISWSRNFGATSVGVSWSHSQTRTFHTYGELLALSPKQPGDTSTASDPTPTRDSVSVSLSQSLGIWGSVSLSGSRSTSWGSNAVQNNVSLGYNTTIRDIGIGVSMGLSTQNGSSGGSNGYDNTSNGGTGWSDLSGSANRTDRTVAVNISLPLGKWLSANSVNGTYSYSRSNGEVSQQAGLSGSAMNGDLSYAVSQGVQGSKGGSTSLGYSGRYGAVSTGYSYGSGSNSVSYGVTGGMALHAHGITLGRSVALGGGNALVEVPGVGGVSVGNAVTDWRGYALLGSLTPYDLNRVRVDMTNIPGNLELDASSKNVVPTRGALVAVPFLGRKGYRLLLTLTRDKGDAVPFGSSVTLELDDKAVTPVTGIVSDDSQVYLAGMPMKGTVTASWGDDKASQCTANYTLPDTVSEERLATVTASCK
ncbi:fimbria/pilus outer membrane usher protein [Serratia bockelmannii]|uniref:fimbria/pilus outer membrane usher protein n=1 Tax=Serratia bockelmannii TaxID=2703793 RepID=UPI00235FD93C|nr:fimbria/pilus outer membrane usher protein [Serratia bockelmannii]